MSSSLPEKNGPWYSEGRYWVSPHNFAPEVRSQFTFSPHFRIVDSTIRKILMSPSERITVTEALHLAEKLREAGVRTIFLNLLWHGSKEPEALGYDIIKAIYERFDFDISLHIDGLHQPGWERKIDTGLALGARDIGVLLPTSPAHHGAPTEASKRKVLEQLEAVTGYIRKTGAEASTTSHDTARTDFSWLTTYLRRAIELGHVRLDIADSSGTLSPEGAKYFLRKLRAELHTEIPFSFHIHQDLGLADADRWLQRRSSLARCVGQWRFVSRGFRFASKRRRRLGDPLWRQHRHRSDEACGALQTGCVAHVSRSAASGIHRRARLRQGILGWCRSGHQRRRSLFPAGRLRARSRSLRCQNAYPLGPADARGNGAARELKSLGLEATPEDVERLRQVLIQKRSERHEYPRWLEDDEVTAIARELLAPRIAASVG